MRIEAVDREMDVRVEALGYEVVLLEWGGSPQRPILRLRVDRSDAVKGNGVTVDECARVSRALEAWLDESGLLPERYVLEVSSPGVERPLLRRRDFLRFQGNEIRVKTIRPVDEVGSSRLEGVLEGVEEGAEAGAEGSGESYTLLLRLPDNALVRLPRRAVAKAQLVYRWEDDDEA